MSIIFSFKDNPRFHFYKGDNFAAIWILWFDVMIMWDGGFWEFFRNTDAYIQRLKKGGK